MVCGVKPSLVRTLQILFRQRWIVVNVWIVTVVIVVTASYTLPSIYTASAKFLVIPGNEQLPIFTVSSTVADRVSSNEPQSADILSEIEVLESRPVLERVVDRIRRERAQTIDTGTSAANLSGPIKWLRDTVDGLSTGWHDFLVSLHLVTVPDDRERTIAALHAALKAQPVRLSNVFTVEYNAPDPTLAASVVNALAEEYLAYRRDVYKPVGIVEHFKQKLEDQKNELKAAEGRLRDYQDQYNIANLEVEIETTLRLLEDAKKNGAFNRQVDQYASRLATLRAAAPVISDLRFDVANNQTLYERYLQKYDEVSSNAELNEAKFANVRLIEPASPAPVPIFPNRLLNLLLATVLGGLGGIGVALVLNYFTNKLNTIEDVEQAGIAALGSVPRWSRRRRKSAGPAANRSEEAFSFIAEQVIGTGATGLVLSGTGAHVGCTTVSAGLALAMSKHMDRRLLIVEADSRQPRMHQLFHVSTASQVRMASESQRDLAQIIRPTPYENVDLLAVDRETVEALDPARVQSLLGASARPYDIVIVDAPPLFTSATAFALAKGLKGWGVILVLEAGRTSAQVAHRAAALLERQGIALFGAILNKRENSVPGFIYRRL
jgi:uncharacterized protein involved in exopolysaccharide biosynthesis/Mrp family chromosome partitioning ATPase